MKLTEEMAEQFGKQLADVVKAAIKKGQDEMAARLNALEARVNLLEAEAKVDEAKSEKGKKR